MTTFKDMYEEASDLAGASAPEEIGRIKRFLNEEYITRVNALGSAIKTSATITLVNGQGDYDVTAAPFSLADFVKVQMPIYAWGGISTNQTTPLSQVTPQEIFWLRRNPVSGVVRVYGFNGSSTLMLYPAPSTGDTMQLSYEFRPPLMAADSDLPVWIGLEDQPVLIYAAAYRAALLSKSPIAAGLLAEKKAREDVSTASQNRLGGSAKSMRRGGKRFIPHDNSMDLGGRW